MLKQISIQEALDRYLNGKLVPAMVPSESGDWEEMDLITLNGLLDKLILFGDFDEKPNHVEESTQKVDLAQAVEEAAELPFVTVPQPTARRKQGVKVKFDLAELIRAEESGMDKKTMAKHFSCSEPTLAKYLKEAHAALDLHDKVIGGAPDDK